ncbi:2TM domain-containing protein [Pseudomonas sp. SCB32]|uniref:2TM domain-containing protein n=1 Tax=Pseudomonas sp. SCB32 TaxID=2653853 RepID=UPI0012653993|nr:2TM domain-containing protein [Pseudomonas sp. SCB32]
MLHDKVKSLRLARAWSQEHLAELASLSVRTVQRIENDEQASLETLSALAAVFDVTVAELSMAPAELDARPAPALDTRIEDAKARVARESAFFRRLITWGLTSAVLVVINLLTSPGYYWFIWPVAIWGGLLVARALRLFILRDWLIQCEQRRLQKLLRR